MASSKKRKTDSKKRKHAKTSTSTRSVHRSTPTTPEGLFDQAVRHRTTKELTSEQAEDFQSIIKAWSAFVANDDETMSTALKKIGTKSLALDWKLLLRGFAAYSRNDDERAVENWRRVNATRPCGKIATAALALVGDSSAANSPASWKRIGTLIQNDVVIGLAELAHEVDNTHDMQQALRVVKQRRTMFQTAGLLEPISNVLYHAMFNDGEPRDAAAYLNMLPAPPRDPMFLLLGGLIIARAGAPDQSSEFLKQYAEWLPKHQAGWPADVHRRALAKVIVERANQQLEESQGVDPFAFFGFDKPKPKPSANILPHLRQAQQADPDWHDLTLWVVRELPRHNEAKRATELGEAYLAKHPDSWAMCHAVGVAYAVMGDWTASVTFQARASATDPLNKSAVRTVGWIASIAALKLLFAAEDDQAKAILTKYETPIRDNFPAVSAAIHFMIFIRQKDYEAAEKVQAAALAKVEGRAEFIYLLGVLVTQFKVKADLKKAVTTNMTALWTAVKTKPIFGVHLFNTWKLFSFSGIEYKGIKTHLKSILAAMIADDPKEYSPQVQFNLVREFIGYRKIAEAEVLVAGLKKAVVKGVTSILQATVEEGKHPKDMNQEKIDRLLDDAERSLYRAKPELHAWLSNRINNFSGRNPLDFSPFFKTLQSLALGADPYKILDVATTADDTAIRSAYMQKVRQFPPESHGEEFARVRQAYECLNNLDSRTNLWLFEHGLLDSPETMLKSVLAKLPRGRLKLDHVAKAMD